MQSRVQLLYLGFLVVVGAIILRLAYWQLIKGGELKIEARDQYVEKLVLTPERGEITTSDGFPLVVNKPVYNVTAYTPTLKSSPREIIDQILPLLQFDIDEPSIATDPARRELKLQELRAEAELSMLDRLSNRSYAVLARSISLDEKLAIDQLALPGIDFEESFVRSYPEASMSAHLTGFVGRDDLGEPTGYFGLEGYYNRELAGKTGVREQEKDASGNPLIIGDFRELMSRDGRTLKLHLERGAQYLAEQALKAGLTRYGAVSGEVLVMDPQTGGILAMVSLPSYDPGKFYNFETSLYKNPAVSNSYEPGSTFKVLVMAAALDSGAVKPGDRCDICTGPLPLDKYLIKTWNGEYHPDSTPSEILENSDNIGMVWVANKLGGEKMVEYLRKFGFGEKTGIDLQEEIAPALRDKWGEIDYATTSFGQGIAVTSIEMLRAVAAIGNGGIMMEPRVVKQVIGEKTVDLEPRSLGRVISEDAASELTSMMVASAEHGDAKWARLPDYKVAGKTGTAQIPVSGHYDTEKTIASFIGFAPAENPKFAMLVKLREPTSSPWGSETAAPLWFSLCRSLLLHYNIPPGS